jgi:hypothetical protein
MGSIEIICKAYKCVYFYKKTMKLMNKVFI